MKNSTRRSRFMILVLMVLFVACSTEKKVDNEMITEGTYVYMFMIELAGTRAEMIQVKRDVATMLSKIPDIIDVVIGLQDVENAKYNLGAMVRFKDKAAREAYASNPHHVALGDQYSGSPLVVEIVKVEYEVGITP